MDVDKKKSCTIRFQVKLFCFYSRSFRVLFSSHFLLPLMYCKISCTISVYIHASICSILCWIIFFLNLMYSTFYYILTTALSNLLIWVTFLHYIVVWGNNSLTSFTIILPKLCIYVNSLMFRNNTKKHRLYNLYFSYCQAIRTTWLY